MRIGVDAHVLAGGYQGTRTYIGALYGKLLEIARQHEFVFLGAPPGAFPSPRAETVSVESWGRIARLSWGAGRLLKEHKVDLYHVQYVLPLYCPVPGVVTIQDILPETFPKLFPGSMKWSRSFSFRLSARRAAQVHAGSQYTRGELIDRYGLREGEVFVVPSGVDAERFAAVCRGEGRHFLTSLVGAADAYILTVGRLETRKNYGRLVQAFGIVRAKTGAALRLVIVGQKDHGWEQLYRELAMSKESSWIHVLSSVSDADLVRLYCGADLFAYPSLAEGFGIPPLEAMAAGVPVVSSKRTAMGEVVGDAALELEPEDVDQMADAIETALGDSELRQRLCNLGAERVRQFTWEKAAAMYLEAISRL